MPKKSHSPIRWAGGKSRLVPLLHSAMPETITGRVFEPFAGGAALCHSLPGRGRVLADANAELTNFFIQVRDHCGELMDLIEGLDDTSAAAYYAIRCIDPHGLHPLDRAARFYFVNRMCFNGLWRENRHGGFNVAYRKKERKVLCDREALLASSTSLQGVEIRTGNVAVTVADAGPGDFVYLDPPYIPAGKASFTRYLGDGFNVGDHERLASLIRDLISRGVTVMLSNSDTLLTRTIYAGLGPAWTLQGTTASRSIAANAAKRGPAGEVIGVSYDLAVRADLAATQTIGEQSRAA